MKTKYLILATAALVLAACNKQEAPAAAEQDAPQAVTFDSYLNRGLSTRAGAEGTIDLTKLKVTGFGVFAYYTDNNDYDAQSMPNFMYNQKVTYADGTGWSYTPVKYWPNEYGSNAKADEVDKVSFFAYAPYVKVVPATGKVDVQEGSAANATAEEFQQDGITGMIRNSANGDPILKYIGSFDPAKSVDLCWGVVGDTDVNWNIVQTPETAQAMTAGKPWLNVQHPKGAADQKLKFTFNHALSKLNVQIDADVDVAAHDETSQLAAGTKIYVRSITFSGFAMKGALNLNNGTANTAEWLDYAGTNNLVTGEDLVIYDGRKDGKEGVDGAVASNEKVLGLNPDIISNDKNTTNGVTHELKNLFGKSGDTAVTAGEFIYVIPTGDDITVTIDYDVETEDSNLPTLLSDGTKYGSSINNRITKTVSFESGSEVIKKFENGKAYTIKLHLGMNSVKFDAAVTAWDVTAGETNLWLPANGTN